jgi:hypothetical protein
METAPPAQPQAVRKGPFRKFARPTALALTATSLLALGFLGLAFLWHSQRDDAVAALKGVQASLRTAQQQNDSLQGQINALQNAPPRFVLVTSNFTSACDRGSCPVSASFRNEGGQGSAVAIFAVTNQDGSTTYAACSAAIPSAPRYGAATVACSAAGAPLSDYFTQNPRGRVYLKVTVSNP